MLSSCKRSCKVCGIIDENDFGKPQEIPRSKDFDKVKEIVKKSTEYMKRINEDEKYDAIRDKCLNLYPDCSFWALGSGCDDNPTFMKQQCAPACQSCDFVLRMHDMCKPDPNSKNAIEIGGMDLLFHKIIKGAVESGYDPTVWSRPKNKTNAQGSLTPCEEDVTNPCNVPDGPWVVTLENFISSKEVNVLKEWGAKMGYQRSQAGDKVLDVRTSSQAVRFFHAAETTRIIHFASFLLYLTNNNCGCDYLRLFSHSGALDSVLLTLWWLHSDQESMNSHKFQSKTLNICNC